jgi:hypothetical protein
LSKPNLQAKHLLVVLGPATAGKSTFIDELMSAASPDFADKLGTRDPADWQVVKAADLDEMRGKRLDRVMFHYALSLPVQAELEGEDIELSDRRWPRHAQFLDLVEAADRVSFVVIWATREVMRQRTLKRMRRVWFKWERIKNPIKFGERLVKITRRERRLRRCGDRMQAFYSKLIDFCDREPNATTWVYDPLERPARLRSPQEWRDQRGL